MKYQLPLTLAYLVFVTRFSCGIQSVEIRLDQARDRKLRGDYSKLYYAVFDYSFRLGTACFDCSQEEADMVVEEVDMAAAAPAEVVYF